MSDEFDAVLAAVGPRLRELRRRNGATLIAQAAFWAAALGYAVEDNRVLIERLLSAGAIEQDAVVTTDDRPAFRTLQAVRHPDDPVQEGTGIGLGKRLLFQQVPEPKTVKNRLHLDLHAGPRTCTGEHIGCLLGRAAESGLGQRRCV